MLTVTCVKDCAFCDVFVQSMMTSNNKKSQSNFGIDYVARMFYRPMGTHMFLWEKYKTIMNAASLV